MANHNCNGDYYKVKRKRYYRCLWDGTVMEANSIPGPQCPHCHRTIADTKDHGAVPVRVSTEVQVQFPTGWRLHQQSFKRP